ncbi:hypothetical protein [Fischerella sp. PCC 9605]|uniref:hypothetical protein n=1 Tax=Fischerella sp. PCC 9605 TaxID=1173024 RepID=UPI000478F12F|nr:hypothetical protein [Fischerella sp. PCC 9605]
MSAPFNNLRNKGIILAMLGVGIGAVICLFPNSNNIVKTLGAWLAVGSIGSLVATQFIVDSAESLYETLREENEKKFLKTYKQIQELESQQKVIQALETELQIACSKLKKRENSNYESTISFIQANFDEFQSQISKLLERANKQYPEMKTLMKLTSDFDSYIKDYSAQIKVLSNQSSAKELIESSLAVQYGVIYYGSLLKVKILNSVIIYLRQQLDNELL